MADINMQGVCHCNYRLISFFVLFLVSSIFLKIPSPSIIPIWVHFQHSRFITGKQSARCTLLPPLLFAPPSLFHIFYCQPATIAHTYTDDWHIHTACRAALPWHLSQARRHLATLKMCLKGLSGMWLYIYYTLIPAVLT